MEVNVIYMISLCKKISWHAYGLSEWKWMYTWAFSKCLNTNLYWLEQKQYFCTQWGCHTIVLRLTKFWDSIVLATAQVHFRTKYTFQLLHISSKHESSNPEQNACSQSWTQRSQQQAQPILWPCAGNRVLKSQYCHWTESSGPEERLEASVGLG